eukprot:SAG31_NODE_8190_length_1500_cov_1.585296_1_plen_251_part_10
MTPDSMPVVGLAAACSPSEQRTHSIQAGLSDEDLSAPCSDAPRTRIYRPSTLCGLQPYTFDNVPDIQTILAAQNGHKSIRTMVFLGDSIADQFHRDFLLYSFGTVDGSADGCESLSGRSNRAELIDSIRFVRANHYLDMTRWASANRDNYILNERTNAKNSVGREHSYHRQTSEDDVYDLSLGPEDPDLFEREGIDAVIVNSAASWAAAAAEGGALLRKYEKLLAPNHPHNAAILENYQTGLKETLRRITK